MEKKYLNFLAHSPGITSNTLKRLIAYFGSAEKIYCASRKDLLESNLLAEDKINAFIEFKNKTDPEHMLSLLDKKSIEIVTLQDNNYPSLLKEIYNPPYLLYYKGNLEKFNKTIAIVGSRKATPYGEKITRNISRSLSEHGFTIVSGMARGIDSFSHLGALDVQGKTIAVLGNGVDVLYPPENNKLYNSIIAEGCILSEFPPGSPPESWRFPARNRIISGLSLGVVVVEAAHKSGALITVDFALEQGREVFSVPGPINSKYSLGTNELIKQGAKPLTCIEDVLEQFDTKLLSENSIFDKAEVELSDIEKKILTQLEYIPIDIDYIASETGFSSAEINAACIMMEMKGLIKKTPGKKYIRID